MQDACERVVHYLRLSLTPACALQCVYCRPDVAARRIGSDLLTADESERLVRHLVMRHGLRKVRLTGGEPTNRPDLVPIVRRLAAIDGLGELAMTTNGLTLAQQARPLAAAGLRRVNISLDSLRAEGFRRIAGEDCLESVLRGIEAAVAAGLAPVKLNTVVVRGFNDGELPDLVRFAAAGGHELRFIELMPMGPLAALWRERCVFAAEIRRRLDGVVASWTRLPDLSGSAERYRVVLADGRHATIGLIRPMSAPFCSRCDRIRIAADGTFHACLMDRPAGTLLPAIRPTFDPDRFDAILQRGLQTKPPAHRCTGTAVMTDVGG